MPKPFSNQPAFAHINTTGVVALLIVLGLLTPINADPPREKGLPTDSVAKTAPPLRSGPPRVLVEFNHPVTCLVWSADGRRIAAGDPDGTVHITDVATGKSHDIPTFKGDGVTALAFSPDGKTFATYHKLLRVQIWETDTGARFGGYSQYDHEVDHVAFMPNGEWVISVWPNGSAKMQAVKKGPAEGLHRGGPNLVPGGCSAIAPDGTVGCSCWPNGPVGVMASGPGNKSEFGDDTSLDVGKVRCLALGPGGRLLAVGNDDGVQLWDMPAKKKSRALAGREHPTVKVAISADGHTLVALASDELSLLAWDLATNKSRCRISHNHGPVGALALSPDGKWLATTVKDGHAIFLWKVEARELVSKSPLELSAKELATAWNDLAGPDHEKADTAWRKLGAAGDAAIPFLKERIRPIAVPAIDPKQVEKWVADLDSNQFATRERALKELEAARELAIVPLQRLLEGRPSVEARIRAEPLFKKLKALGPTQDQLRVLEAIDLLEQQRTSKAVGLLEEIERDAPIPRVRDEAHRALQRIAVRPKEK